jgi:hypothetical protein
MASRKDEKDKLRQERQEAERRSASEARKRLVLGYVVAGVLAVAVIGGVIFAIASGGSGGGSKDKGGDGGPNVNTLYGVVPDGLDIDNREGTVPPDVSDGNLTSAAETAGCDLKLNLPDEGSTHVDPPTPASLPDYKTNPPTSGDHYPTPLADGAFLQEPPLGNFVHSMEHGRIEIQYSPDLSDEDQLALKGVFDSDRAGMIMFPNPDMPYDVATTAWTNLMGCKSFQGDATLDAIRDFRDEFRGRGPEAIAF